MTATVNDNTMPMKDIHDIKPALAIATHWPWWAWLIIVLAVAALAALAWWLRKRRRSKSDEEATVEPPLPPDVDAFQRLDRLAARGGADPKQFYFSLSAILRLYLERRYDFPAAEMTTEELLPQIQRLNMADTLAGELKRFCHSSDPIKFADAASNQAGMSKDLAFVRQFVEQTTAAQAPAEHQYNESDLNAANQEPPRQLPHQNPTPGRSKQTNNKTQNTKHQTPNTKHQTPNTKH